MEKLQSLVKSSADEIQKVVCSSSIVGEPQVMGETTIIPLVSTGFWFAGGGGHEVSQKKVGEGEQYGTGGGASVKPVALVVFDGKGARVESLSGITGALEHIAEHVPDMAESFRGGPKKATEKK